MKNKRTNRRDLAAWEKHVRDAHGWTMVQCAQALEVSYGRYLRMRDEGGRIPSHIGLAMSAIVAGLEPYRGAKVP